MGAALSTRVVDQLFDWHWRLNNLYTIKDEKGREVPFRMNWAQQALYDDMHYCNVIPKARQLGFTTFIQLFMLDACLWRKNIRSGTIAHSLDSVHEIFDEKIRFPYSKLPDGVKNVIVAEQNAAGSLKFSNGSRLIVGTSLRGGTYQYLHISELGYICAHYPEKAEEIRTGALNTVHPGQVIFIESTAKGKLGLFAEVCEGAKKLHDSGAGLGLMDFRLQFFPWWRHPGYTLDEKPVLGDKMIGYFAKLKAHGIELTEGQKAWYTQKFRTQKAKIKSEYPSTYDEAFEGHEGVYFDCFDRDLHVVKPFKIPAHWTRFRAEDWGTARPFCIHWFAVASETVKTADGKIIPRGALICYREWYGVDTDEAGDAIPNVGIKSTPQRVGYGIVERENEKIHYHVSDPGMWQDQGGPSQAEQQSNAIRKAAKELRKSGSNAPWRKGHNQRVARGKAKGGWDEMRERMLGEDLGDGVERPMIYWFGTCIHAIRTIPSLLHDDERPEDLDSKGEDHAADTDRYACMSRPYTRPKPTARKPMTDIHSVSMNQLWQERERL